MATRVGRWLVERAAARMRRDGYCAGRISIHIGLWKRNGHHWQQTLNPSQEEIDKSIVRDALGRGLSLVHNNGEVHTKSR